MKSRTYDAIAQAYNNLLKRLASSGFRPRVHWLDNEAFEILKHLDRNEHVKFQLAPPHIHRCNFAEKAIRTWKDHYVVDMCSTDKKGLVHLWDRFIKKGEITLNMIRPFRKNQIYQHK